MGHYQRGLVMRFTLVLLGILLATESYFLRPQIKVQLPTGSSQNNYYDSSPGWSSDDSSNYDNNDYDTGSGWDWGDSGDSGWDSSDSGWDSGGDSGSWDSGGGDSGSW